MIFKFLAALFMFLLVVTIGSIIWAFVLAILSLGLVVGSLILVAVVALVVAIWTYDNV